MNSLSRPAAGKAFSCTAHTGLPSLFFSRAGRNPPRSTPLRLHTPSGEAFLFKHILSSFGRFAIRLLFLCSRSAAACIRLYTSRKAENPAFCIRAKKRLPPACMAAPAGRKRCSSALCGKTTPFSAQGMCLIFRLFLPSAAGKPEGCYFPSYSQRISPVRPTP